MNCSRSYDFREVSASVAVLEVVAEREEVDVAAISEPLGEGIDPDALDALMVSSVGKDDPVTVGFSFLGYRITVHSDGCISIE